MQQSAVDRLYMQAALRLAERGLFTVTRGNPRVGCLVVKDNEVVGRGWHQKDGGSHAEVFALEQAGSRAKGSTAYVTLEPCCFEGRTPACTTRIIEAGVKRVVVGARDIDSRVKGQGIGKLKSHGINVKLMGLPVPGNLNPGVHLRLTQKRPFVRIKIALSLDGRIALDSGDSQWITGEAARRDVQYWRARSGAIITGIGTVLADNPRLTVREPEYQGSEPWRVVLDNKGRFPSNAAMLDEPGRNIIVCGSEAEKICERECLTVWREETAEINVVSVLRRLAKDKVNELLVEAGSRVVGSFLASKMWDEMIAYVAPKFMGSEGLAVARLRVEEMADTVSGEIQSIESFGEDVRVVLKRVASN